MRRAQPSAERAAERRAAELYIGGLGVVHTVLSESLLFPFSPLSFFFLFDAPLKKRRLYIGGLGVRKDPAAGLQPPEIIDAFAQAAAKVVRNSVTVATPFGFRVAARCRL